MNIIKVIELIGIGYMANDLYKNKKQSRIIYYNNSNDKYSITRTVKRVICQKIEKIFETKYYVMVNSNTDSPAKLVVNTLDIAEEALDVIKETYDNYGSVTMADAIEACQKCSLSPLQVSYKDNLIGWNAKEEIESFRIKPHYPEGYMIETPEPKSLRR